MILIYSEIITKSLTLDTSTYKVLHKGGSSNLHVDTQNYYLDGISPSFTDEGFSLLQRQATHLAAGNMFNAIGH